MIIVIADDFTGAAEIGGIGLRYNLKVEVNTGVNLQSQADLLIIATDTRSMQKHEAELEMQKVTQGIAKLNPEFIFKKVDSVLRGYVTEELLVHIRELNHSRVLLVPANPALGRTIVNGEYLLSTGPLHLSNFSNDPEFPAQTSSVIGLLREKGLNIHSQKKHETLKDEGIIVGDALNNDDLKAWANKADKNMLLAGAAGFFTALLDKLIISGEQTQPVTPREFKKPFIIVSGTAFGKSRDAISNLKKSGAPVSYMPLNVIEVKTNDKDVYQDWYLEVISYITKFGSVLIAINPLDTKNLINQAKLFREKTAILVKIVFEQMAINELLIEGGSTASAILKQLAISKMYPVEELAPGVIRMRVSENPELYITMKPGSYSWPDSIRQYSLY